MRILLGIAASLLLSAVVAAAGRPLEQTFPEMQSWMVPSSDETPITDAAGNDETDVALDCYAAFRKRDPELGHLGPPSIRFSPTLGYILRADFTSADRKKVHRFACLGNGSSMQEEISAPPLYPPGTTSPDAATERAVEGWSARRKAEEIRDQTRFPPPDSQTISLLEGIWSVDERPKNGSCLAETGTNTQIEFEFRKSGGRVLIYEPYDLFTAIQIAGIEKSGDTLVLQAKKRQEGQLTFMRLRMAGDHLELLPVRDPVGSSTPAAPVKSAYRCGDPDTSVNASMSPEQLAAVAPPVTGGWALVANEPGISNHDRCQGKGVGFHTRWLQIELYGPAHYFVFGWNFWPDHKLGFDFIRSVKTAGDGVVKLGMQEHLEQGPGWDVPESRGKSYELTLIDHGDSIEIPELATTFAKCSPTDPAAVGMHRL